MTARSKPPEEAAGFYETALSRAEKARLPKARATEGLDEEIALLRIKLHDLATGEPDKFDLLLKATAFLARLVALKYKLSDKPAEELSKNIAGVLRGIGGALEPERFDGVTGS